MKLKTFSAAAAKAPILQALAVTIQTGTAREAREHLSRVRALPGFKSSGWRAALAQLADVLETGAPAWSLFKLDGNSKLPFVAWSSLPGVTCPGAGACLSFCYSYRAWRFPGAFARQAQNAYLLRHRPDLVRTELQRIAADVFRGEAFDLRLYVDGDFSSLQDVEFWAETLHQVPSAQAYGYSKSFSELLAYQATGKAWPANYRLNLSSGHAHDVATVDQVQALPIARGTFEAIAIGRRVKSSDHGTRETSRAVREAAGARKVFVCPGKCGSCTPSGHACGSAKFQGIAIAIAMH